MGYDVSPMPLAPSRVTRRWRRLPAGLLHGVRPFVFFIGEGDTPSFKRPRFKAGDLVGVLPGVLRLMRPRPNPGDFPGVLKFSFPDTAGMVAGVRVDPVLVDLRVCYALRT
jgi:hypothetical protein